MELIIQTLRAHLGDLRERYGVSALAVFGSYVRGAPRKRSDLDILVEFDEDARMTLFRFVKLEEHLSELLGVKVDLVMRSALKAGIGERILAEALPV